MVVILTGASGTGKSTYAKFLSEQTGTPVLPSNGRKFIKNYDELASNPELRLATQLMIIQDRINEEQQAIKTMPDIILDRSVLDSFVYLNLTAEELYGKATQPYCEVIFPVITAVVEHVYAAYKNATVLLALPDNRLKVSDLIIRGSDYVYRQEAYTKELISEYKWFTHLFDDFKLIKIYDVMQTEYASI